MVDYRINYVKAKILISEEKPLVFRKIVKSGKMLERVLTPVMHTKGTPFYYTSYRYEYVPKRGYEGYDEYNVDKSKMVLITQSTGPSRSTKNGEVLSLVEELLKYYKLCDTNKGGELNGTV